MNWRYYDRKAKKKTPKDGVKAYNFGLTWWGKKWIEALKNLGGYYSNRLPRGRTYARAGRVRNINISAGEITSEVIGTDDYEVTIKIRAFTEKEWEKVFDELGRQAAFVAKLLSGEKPQDIDSALQKCNLSLFPALEKDIEADCSCPDWANPCKHIAATHYIIGSALDGDPFLLFELRGKSREEVLDALSERQSSHTETGTSPDATEEINETLESKEDDRSELIAIESLSEEEFLKSKSDLTNMSFHIVENNEPILFFDILAPPPAGVNRKTLQNAFADAYRNAMQNAVAAAFSNHKSKLQR